MATIPRHRNFPRKPEPPKPPPVRMYSLEQMRSFGWISEVQDKPGIAAPRMPDPRIPAGVDPRIPRKDET